MFRVRVNEKSTDYVTQAEAVAAYRVARKRYLQYKDAAQDKKENLAGNPTIFEVNQVETHLDINDE